MAGLNIEQILRDLERVKTAEELFAEGLQDEQAEVETVEEPEQSEDPEQSEEPKVETVEEPEQSEEPKVEEVEAEEKTAELQKIAAEYDAKGRILAKSFYDELQKLATAVEYSEDSQEFEQEKIASDDPAVRILTSLYNKVF